MSGWCVLLHSRPPSRRACLEYLLAVVAGVLALSAVVWPNWIEAFGVDPDRGDGTLEWAIPILLAVAAFAVGLIARRHWHLDVAGTLES